VIGTKAIIIAAAIIVFAGCAPAPVKPRERTYGFASSQLAPDPIYNRLRIVHLPYVKPARDSYYSQQTAENYAPNDAIISLTTSHKTLEQIAKDLGTALQYSTYCSSVLAPRIASSGTEGDVTIKGSIDQVADEISKREGIKVVVDHQSREIRFLSATPEPELPSSSIE
jgi:hypothetical protein